MEKYRESWFGQGNLLAETENFFGQDTDSRNSFGSEVMWYVYVGFDLAGLLFAMIFAWVFYHRFWLGFVAILAILPYHRFVRQICRKRRERQFRQEFRDALQQLQSYMQAGRSIENAMEQTDVRLQAEKGHGVLAAEWHGMLMQIRHNRSVERAWEDFAGRCPIQEVRQFAEVLSVAKRSGGSMVQIIQTAVYEITLLMQTEEEIKTVIASKKLQMYVLETIPILLMVYLNVASPDMLAEMYETFFGNVIMTGCLVVYLTAVWLGRRISDIQV
ncbi:MAG: type II secretion system F family protein [Lachnospiraceae bacterium]|nr:type II secretion system F family protein [Lachnospiraceae bacterium]